MPVPRWLYRYFGRSETWTSVVFAALGFLAAYEAQGFYGNGSLFPMALGLIVGGLALWNLITSAVSSREHTVEAGRADDRYSGRRNLSLVLAVFVLILGIVYLLGLAVGGGIGIGIYFLAMERFKILRAAIIGGLTGVAVWFVFDEMANLSVYHGLLL